MSDNTGVLTSTITSAALHSAIGYMDAERRARLANAAREAARDRPVAVTVLAAAVSFLAIRTIRVALARNAASHLSGGANGADPDAHPANGRGVRHAAR